MRAPLALFPLLAVLSLPVAACGSSTPVDMWKGTDAGAGFDAPAREVRPGDGAGGEAQGGAGGDTGTGVAGTGGGAGEAAGSGGAVAGSGGAAAGTGGAAGASS